MEFRDPPARRMRSISMPEPDWARGLVKRPNKWAMVETFPHGQQGTVANRQHCIRYNKYAWQREFMGEWDATYRDTGELYELFVMYLP